MKKYLISVEAIGSIFNECYKDWNGSETGGVLTGLKGDSRIITDFIPSSKHAERESHSYYQSSKDVSILNYKLIEHQREGKDFVGYVHKHPPGIKNLSQGDASTCHKILSSPNYAINNKLVMGIVTQVDGNCDLPIFFYFVSLNLNDEVVIEKIKINILPKRCIEEITQYV